LLTSGQSALLEKRTAGLDRDELIRCVKACGFDENRYVENNPDLETAGFDEPQAMLHFLAIGHLQPRDVTCGPFPDGLDGIRCLATRNRDYVTGLFRSLFFSQAKQTSAADRLWNGIARSLIDGVRDMGGQPYFVIGDSHVYHYLRRTSVGEKWLAALPIVCVGGAAMRLAADDSRTGFGQKILQWAKHTAALVHRLDVPIFLKFGGIDAEFLWVRARIKKRAYRFSIDEFDDFARESVSSYGRFLDALTEVMGRRWLRICAAYPAVVDDAYWADVFLTAHGSALASELEKTEIPDRSTRTRLRRLYNEHLRQMCREKSLAFVDDFSPFVDANGETAEICYRARRGRNHHIDYATSEEQMVTVIAAALALKETACRSQFG
jgi:hypothetical protein